VKLIQTKNQIVYGSKSENHPPSFLHQESLGLTLAVASRHQETWLKVWELLFFLKLGFLHVFTFFPWDSSPPFFTPIWEDFFSKTTKNKQKYGGS